MATEFINCLLLLIRMPQEAGFKKCLIGTFVTVRLIFTIWYFLMGLCIYVLMYFTIALWYKKVHNHGIGEVT
jgi:hypothetical protein